MEDVDLRHAKEHLEELIARAARGEEVRIAEPGLVTVRLMVVGTEADATAKPKRRRLGLLEGKVLPPPDGFFDPLTEEELKDWYGDES